MNSWAIRNPKDEARDLYRMVVKGSCSVDSIRELIEVPPDIEAGLLAYAQANPEGGGVYGVLKFRRSVALHFEEFLREQPSLSEECDDCDDAETFTDIEAEQVNVDA